MVSYCSENRPLIVRTCPSGEYPLLQQIAFRWSKDAVVLANEICTYHGSDPIDPNLSTRLTLNAALCHEIATRVLPRSLHLPILSERPEKTILVCTGGKNKDLRGIAVFSYAVPLQPLPKRLHLDILVANPSDLPTLLHPQIRAHRGAGSLLLSSVEEEALQRHIGVSIDAVASSLSFYKDRGYHIQEALEPFSLFKSYEVLAEEMNRLLLKSS